MSQLCTDVRSTTAFGQTGHWSRHGRRAELFDSEQTTAVTGLGSVAWNVNAVLNQPARSAAGGVCLIPTSRYSCAFHLAANVSHSAMYFWFGIGPGVMALSI